MQKAAERYSQLSGNRNNFLRVAVEASRLTLPYLIKNEDDNSNFTVLKTPWQSVGAKSVVNLSSKLMLALMPPQTSFFKLQLKDEKLGTELDPTIRSELDLSFAKIERMVQQHIDASSDRVVIFQAVKHLVVSGNALIFMGKDGLKHYPLNRYVVNRDGNGNVLEIVTKEMIDRQLLDIPEEKPNAPGNDGEKQGAKNNDVEVYTYVRLDDKSGRWIWHQEVFGKIIPGSRSTAPKNTSPWLPLRWMTVDGEDYGRGRVEEFLGDLKSLEALSQALVEGSAVAAKVVFLVSPSSTTKPQTIAQAGNGAIIQGRPEDVQVVQVQKQADFATAMNMAERIERRISDAFLVLQVRQSERTTAEEVRLTQLELEQQLGGLFSLLTVEFLVPYLNRTMHILQRSGQLPKIPKDLVNPTIVAGVNALGRGQDRESLTQFIMTISQTMGPEVMAQYLDPQEYLKRLAASSGIDYLNLVKSQETLDQENEQAQQQQMQQTMMDQAGQFANSPMADPSKNPQIGEMLGGEDDTDTPGSGEAEETAGNGEGN
jgi:hypothetical protein